MKSLKISPIPTQKTGQTATQAARPSIWQRDIQFGNAFPAKARQQFYHTLGLLLESGLGLLDCMEVMVDQFPQKTLSAMLTSLQEDLVAGASLSQALAKQKRFFSPFEVFTLKMGEQTGQMATMLQGLAHYYEKRVALRRKLTQAFSYPVAVIVIALLVMSFMIGFVVPMFEDIFSRFDAKLPPITQRILDLANAFEQYGLWILLGIGGLIVGIRTLRNNPGWRRFWSKVGLRLPGLGPLWLKIHLARLCYSFSLLLKAKVNLDQALVLLAEVTPFFPLQVALKRVHANVLEGLALHEAVKQEDIFPLFFRQMVKVGEKTARLDQMFEQMAHNLEAESDASLSQLTRFLEPVLIIFLGGIVAVILVAMYLPMFELSNAVG
ncbi:MAG: type II secretion system F family protein [Bacteroidota bacterium]